MNNIGILLPGSTLYPSIGIDFLQGIRSCHNFYNTTVQITASPIGYGLDEDAIHKEAEKFLLGNNVDAVVIYASDLLAKRLSPLFTATGKLLIIANAGANYPLDQTAFPNTIFHSLNDCTCNFLTGKLCAAKSRGNNAIYATSFYDGGYQHSHAMSNAFLLGGGEIKFNFVSHLKKEEFNTDGLAAFIKENPDTKELMCVFSGDMARLFYEKIKPLQQEFDLQLFGSPMMFDSTPGDFTDTMPYVKLIQGYTHWVSEVENIANNEFKNFYQKENGKDANLFSMHGWETAILLNEYFNEKKTAINTSTSIEKFKNKKIFSPRGTIKINKDNLVVGPAYLVSAKNKLEIKIDDIIEDTTAVVNEMIEQIPHTEFSAWRNTYLCI